MVHYTTLTLAELMDAAVEELMDWTVRELEPGCEPFPLVVEVDDDGRPWELTDGHHRLSGMVRWAESRGLDLGKVEVQVVAVVEHEALEGAKMNDRDAIAAILAGVGFTV